MINRTHRFHGHGSLRFVYQRGQSVRGESCSLKYTLNSRLSSYRVAVVVSRKVSKSAVVRNRVRRRIYEIVRRLEERITEPYDLVFVVYDDGLREMPSPRLEQNITTQLTKAGVLTPSANRPKGDTITTKENKT